MEEDLANLSIGDKEEDLLLEQDEEEGYENDFYMCLVGKILTNGIVHFPSMRNVLAELWHLIGIEEKRTLFLFYNELDLKRVIDSMPWFFNRHLIISHRLEKMEGSNTSPDGFHNFLGAKPQFPMFGALLRGRNLSLFCFLCGRLGHDETLCLIHLTLGSQEVVFGWDISLRASSRRTTLMDS
ncbi:hypothetical protein CXB51_035234 [Gossypium anomalum]|uniref:DUF4283 domain-containing protein n=1 Tax=Gossypium anomalum TaxID=47600 RepID=A0A8J5Y2F4_9ROSI|nr:hypothetical protein CXB51_035234 [Gossypium anomalum]